jgi:hypothetical protein
MIGIAVPAPPPKPIKTSPVANPRRSGNHLKEGSILKKGRKRGKKEKKRKRATEGGEKGGRKDG